MADAHPPFAMLGKDKVVLRNVVIAVVASTLGAVAIGTSCLGRHPMAVPDRTAEVPPTPTSTAENSNASQAGGVEPVGTTNITSTTIVVNPAQTSQPEPAPVTVINQQPGSAPEVRVAQPVAAPPAERSDRAERVENTSTNRANTEENTQLPTGTPGAATSPVQVYPPTAPVIPVPMPTTMETPSAGSVPSNSAITNPPATTPGGPVQGTQGPTTPGNPYPNNPVNTLPQGRIQQGQLPTPQPPQGAAPPAPTAR